MKAPSIKCPVFFGPPGINIGIVGMCFTILSTYVKYNKIYRYLDKTKYGNSIHPSY